MYDDCFDEINDQVQELNHLSSELSGNDLDVCSAMINSKGEACYLFEKCHLINRSINMVYELDVINIHQSKILDICSDIFSDKES